MNFKEILIGAGIIGAGILGFAAIKKNESPIYQSSGGSSYPSTPYAPTFDFSGLFKDETPMSPGEAFSQTASASTKKEASTNNSSLASGYSSVNTGQPIANIYQPVTTSSPNRFAFNPTTGGIIDIARQQSITQKEYNSRSSNNIFEPNCYYPASTKKEASTATFTNPNAPKTSSIKDLFTIKPKNGGGAF